ncbi:MAG: hypothetical protein IPO09_09545 [Anaeromyxobacter sp.]|nr:hypothetical protein [Anaeromyxobacter sp.]MBL0278643.1 hypothetical protein [Anaeromyxobacter sp.]
MQAQAGFLSGLSLGALGLLCAAGAGCARTSDPAPGPGQPVSSLTLSCGSYDAGLTSGLVLAAVIDPARPSDTLLEVFTSTQRTPVTCRGGERLCLLAFPGIAARTNENTPSPVMVTGDLGGGLTGWTCTPDMARALAQPEGRALLVSGRLEVEWTPVAGAATYAVTLRDLGPPGPPDYRPPRVVGDRVLTGATHATFSLEAGRPPDFGVVEVEAWATDASVPLRGWLDEGGANRSVRAIPVIGAPWTLRQPSELAAGTLDLDVPAGKRLAVILLNVDGRDGAGATLQAAGTGPAAPAAGAAPAVGTRGAGLPHGVARAPVTSPEALTPRDLAQAEATRTFCTFDRPDYDLQTGNPAVRRPASLALVTANALLYVDDQDASGFTSSDWQALGARWDAVQAAVTSRSGPLPDVDANGRFILFFTSALGPLARSVANVYDLTHQADTAPDCRGGPNTQSNHADMVHLHPPFGMEDEAGRPLDRDQSWAVVEREMARTLQRMLDWWRFAGPLGNEYLRNTEITHARMGLAATLAGSGDHVPALRALSAPALFTRAGPGGGFGGYPSLQMYPWDEDGTYQAKPVKVAAADSFLLFLSDRLGPAFDERFFDQVVALRGLEEVSGIPFHMAYALWAGALLFSNEPASPWSGFDFTGPDWTPLHQKFQRFEYAPLEAGPIVPVTLRRNGFDVHVTGVAGPGGGRVTVTSGEATRPYVMAVPFEGSLP